jgi:sterol 14alpha-demethylase
MALSHAKEWYSTHSIGLYVLTIVLVFWAAHIVKQLVLPFPFSCAKVQLPQDPTQPPVIFHLFPWVGSMVTYGMEPYKFFTNARAKVINLETFNLIEVW